MKLEIVDRSLRVVLNPLESFLAIHGSLAFPLDHISYASAEKLRWDLTATRSPGTHIPFLLKAGTYLTPLGREFWLTTVGRPNLVLLLFSWDYNRVVLSVSNPSLWAEQINNALHTG